MVLPTQFLQDCIAPVCLSLYCDRHLWKLIPFIFLEQTRITTNDEASRQQVANLEAFRRIAQAQAEQAERERFLPGAAGVLHGGINAAATIAAQGLTGTSASDLMRLAVPVRDPENGDTISGSGKYLSKRFSKSNKSNKTGAVFWVRRRFRGLENYVTQT